MSVDIHQRAMTTEYELPTTLQCTLLKQSKTVRSHVPHVKTLRQAIHHREKSPGGGRVELGEPPNDPAIMG